MILGMFRKCKQLPQYYLDEAKCLYNKYRPIEIDPHLSLDEKTIAMQDWMTAAHNILKGIEFNPHEIEEVAQECNDILRDGTREILEKLYNARVPIVVFSAGLGDMVEAVLKYNNALFDNVKIISNFLKYKGNQLDGFNNNVFIHAYNKNECALAEDYLTVLGKRQNVLLMGDTTGDASMVDEIEDTKTVLKIGFLYDHVSNSVEHQVRCNQDVTTNFLISVLQVEASLNSFMEKFDIVLVDDQTMRVPMEILQSIL